MKRVFAIFALAAVALWSCTEKVEIPDNGKEDPQKEDPQKPDPEKEDPQKPDPEPTTKDIEFMASFEAEGETWAADAQILLFDGSAVQTLTNSAEAGAIAKFSATVPKDASSYLAYYPAGEGVTLTGTAVTLTLPAEGVPAGAVALPSVAKASGATLSFRPFLATLFYSVGRDDVTKVVFQAAEKVAGSATIDYAGENPAIAATADQITVAGTFVPETEYAIAVPAQTYTNVTVKVFAGEEVVDEVALENVGAIAPGQGLTLPMMAIPKPKDRVFQITAVKVYGGISQQWSCDKTINLFEHPDYFDDTDGRGINALKDNYLVMREDGTFINYAGEDGRNWWFVYSGTVNPQTNKDLDLKGFFDVLPRDEGTVAMNVGEEAVTLTFTKKDQTQSTGIYLPAGTYPLSEEKNITIEELAVVFQYQITDNNWDYKYKDYDIIALHPRAMFIELHELEEGFEVPESAKTFDANFEFVAPEDPIVDPADFDLATLPGKWNVYGSNKEKDAMPKFGLYVLGGSGDDPAFVSPIEKSWDWDDSIWKESDNEIVIKNVTVGSTAITGTTNWWAGADGGFWNYTWKNTGEDLSRFYNKIPKGNTDFTFDLATMTLTWSNGTTAKVLLPGENEFVYGRKLMIPEACFALDFHLGEPIPATADQWKDIDRFINAPLEYVIIFEKTE